jgi:hypothetical protein
VVDVESTYGEGTCFTIELPFTPADRGGAPRTSTGVTAET